MEFENSVLGSAVVISESDAYTTTVFPEGLVVEVEEIVGDADVVEDVDDVVGDAEVVGDRAVVDVDVGLCAI